MLKNHIISLLVIGGLAIFTISLASCKITDTSVVSGPIVHMGQTTFIQTTVALKKGENLLLVNDVNGPHIITNGTWQGTVQKPMVEPGAPIFNKSFSGKDRASIGPFNQAGQFLIYCTIHQGMNLTVTVK